MHTLVLCRIIYCRRIYRGLVGSAYCVFFWAGDYRFDMAQIQHHNAEFIYCNVKCRSRLSNCVDREAGGCWASMPNNYVIDFTITSRLARSQVLSTLSQLQWWLPEIQLSPATRQKMGVCLVELVGDPIFPVEIVQELIV